MNNPNPKISVIMSVYNAEKTLNEAVESVLGQTYPNFEFVIVNDGSRDKTSEILRDFKDRRIKIITNKKSLGLTKSLIKAVDLARGEFVARMDADDVSDKKRLENEINYFRENKKVGLVGTWFEVIDEYGKVIAKHKPAKGKKVTGADLARSNQFVHGSVMFRKDVYEKAGGYRGFFKFAQDYDLWLRISQFSEIAVLPKYLYKWRVHDLAISVDKRALQSKYAQIARESYKQRINLEKETILLTDKESKKRIETLLGVNDKDKATGYLNWAWTLFFYNEYLASYKKTLTSLKLWPFSIEAYFLLILASVFRMFPKKTAIRIKKIHKSL